MEVHTPGPPCWVLSAPQEPGNHCPFEPLERSVFQGGATSPSTSDLRSPCFALGIPKFSSSMTAFVWKALDSVTICLCTALLPESYFQNEQTSVKTRGLVRSSACREENMDKEQMPWVASGPQPCGQQVLTSRCETSEASQSALLFSVLTFMSLIVTTMHIPSRTPGERRPLHVVESELRQ